MIAVDGAGHDLRRGRFDLTPVVAAVERFEQSTNN
jgi:hypothetical protein